MSCLNVIAVLLAIPVGLLLVGYPLAQPTMRAPADRFALAVLAGLAALLGSIAIVNAALPLAGGWAWVCVLPWLAPLGRGALRQELIRDLSVLGPNRRVWILGGMVLAFLIILLWPLLSRPNVVFYDGSPNHDSFFWIDGAEHLKRFSYLTQPVADAGHPFYFSARGIIGLAPGLGRMGTEGLLALVSSLSGISPFRLFVTASAALFFPWVAAQVLLLRTFFGPETSGRWTWAVPLLQPIFVFCHANANTPNVVGVLMGALIITAVASYHLEGVGRRGLVVVLALGVHGLLCSYPEAMPAVAATVGLLLLRDLQRSGVRSLFAPVLALMAGFALNPLTTLRAWNGFVCSVRAVAHGDEFANIFRNLTPATWLPAMTTLSVPLGTDLRSPLLAAGVSGLLVLMVGLAVWRAKDRFGALSLLAGVGVIGGYTVITHFGYGWQKTIQFSAVIVATLLAAAALRALRRTGSGTRINRIAWSAGAAVPVLVLAYATAANIREAEKWSERKYITTEWYEAREYAGTALRNVPVLVDAREFKWPFFYTMWSSYFLPDSQIVFGSDPSAGGYLRGEVERTQPYWVGRPRVLLAGPESPNLLGARWHGEHIAFLAITQAGGPR